MAMFNFVHSVSFSRKTFENPFTSAYRARMREERLNRKNVKLVREFLTQRKKQQAECSNELAYLKQQRKVRSMDKVTYDRLRRVLLLSHEMKRFEMLDLVTSQSAKKN